MKVRLMLCLGIGLIGWVASYPLMIVGTGFGYDVALAEDYVSGVSVQSAFLELSIAVAWSSFWLGVGLLSSSFWRRITTGSARRAPPN